MSPLTLAVPEKPGVFVPFKIASSAAGIWLGPRSIRAHFSSESPSWRNRTKAVFLFGVWGTPYSIRANDVVAAAKGWKSSSGIWHIAKRELCFRILLRHSRVPGLTIRPVGRMTANFPRSRRPSSARSTYFSLGSSVFSCGNGGFINPTEAFPIGKLGDVKQSALWTPVLPSPRKIIFAIKAQQ
jgi:hypothetical protein